MLLIIIGIILILTAFNHEVKYHNGGHIGTGFVHMIGMWFIVAGLVTACSGY